MKKVILAPILLALPLIIGGGVMVMTGVVKPPELEFIQSSWGDVTKDQTEVRTSLVINNPNSMGVDVGNLGLDVRIALNGVELGQGTLNGLELPQGPSTTNLVTVIDNTAIPAWWATHIRRHEKTTARIAPTLRADIFGRSFHLNAPDITREIETDFLSGVNSDQPESFSIGPFRITLKSRQLQWGEVSDQSTEINGHLVLHQDVPVPIVVTRLDFSFVMNEITVAQATTHGPIVLLPNTDTPVPFNAKVANQRLLDWWPTHVSADERTDYRISVGVVLKAKEASLSDQTFPVPLVDFRNQFETDILGRKSQDR